MNDTLRKAVDIGNQMYPNMLNRQVEYGTAGFRDKAEVLPHIMYRMGLLAALRSKVLKGATIGVMVTASHNPEEDNGVKLCDPAGQMLTLEWELLATDLANAKNDQLFLCLQNLCSTLSIDFGIPASVFLGADTRASSPSLAEAVGDGLRSFDGALKDYGLLTTPQLHFVVCCKNSGGTYGTETPEGYYKKLSSAFLKLQSEVVNSNYVPEVHIDGANGVGALALKDLVAYLCQKLKIHIFNCGEMQLNFKCGADHVKVQQTIPVGAEIVPNQRYASLDGDADRLIYFYLDNNKVFHMLDGDKIAALIAKQLKILVQTSDLDLELKVIQTAYANASSTNYIENILKIPVICVPTGVKHLHHEATKYDIGIYFEANGHGTVVFGKDAKNKISEKACDPSLPDSQRNIARKLLNTVDIINETVGDAISDMLLVETILQNLDWSIADWDQLYSDLPCRQLKVKVRDRRMISTTNAERTCVKPEGLQDGMNSIVSNFKNSRAFVRPSGTEDIVRVYAEADTQENADLLAEKIAAMVKEYTT